jgi:quercetin dioxygenase-like cupin family protein
MNTSIQERDPVENLEKYLLQQEQVDCPVTHRFAPGIYLREIFMPAGAVVIGHRHKTEHFNIVIRGVAHVTMGGGEVKTLKAGETFVSKPGVRKCLIIEEDTVWQTVHPIQFQGGAYLSEEDQKKLISFLEPELIDKSDTWLEHEKQSLEDAMAYLEGQKV